MSKKSSFLFPILGVAMVRNNGTNTLPATDFNSGAVEAYDTNFNPVTLAGLLH